MDTFTSEEDGADDIFADIDKDDLLSLPFNINIESYKTQDYQINQDFGFFSNEETCFSSNSNLIQTLHCHPSTESYSDLSIEGLFSESILHSYKKRNRKDKKGGSSTTNAEKCTMYRGKQ